MNEDLFGEDDTISHERLQQKLHYDPETGRFTRISKSRGRGRIGAEAGSVDKDGYVSVCVDYKTYAASRLAWFYMTGKWPDFLVDHRDGDKSNNKWKNLRDVPDAINSQNRHGPHKGKYGGLPLGVNPHGKRFRSSIMIAGKTTRLGTYDTPEEAHEVYLAYRRENMPGNLL